MSRVDLVVNGEIRESQSIGPREAAGHWSVKAGKSSWLALLVRGHYQDQTEMIAAHSSPVIVEVAGSEFFSRLTPFLSSTRWRAPWPISIQWEREPRTKSTRGLG